MKTFCPANVPTYYIKHFDNFPSWLGGYSEVLHAPRFSSNEYSADNALLERLRTNIIIVAFFVGFTIPHQSLPERWYLSAASLEAIEG